MSQRRILLISHGMPPEFRGGTELYVLNLAHALQDAGHDVTVMCGSMEARPRCERSRTVFEGLPVWRIRRQGLFVDNWDKSWSPEVEEQLAAIVEEVRPDVAHVHHWIRLTRGLVATLHRCGVPAVATLHDLWSTCARCFRVRDERLCLLRMNVGNCADCVPRDPWHSAREIGEEIELFHADFMRELSLARQILVPSEAQRDLVSEMMQLPEGNLTVLPHGTISALQPARVRVLAQKIRLGHWGHLYPMKGFHLLLEALQLLRAEERAAFTVECWGEAFDTSYRERLDSLAQGISVHWHGAFQPADLALAQLDWAVLPSMAFESWSFVLDEAFTLGFPVIASKRGALATRTGAAGLLFEPEQAASLAERLREILADAGLRERCHSHIPALPPMSAHAQRLAVIYEAAIASEPREDAGAQALEARHRLHRSLVLEERLKEVMFQRGRVQQEQDRADGLKLELAKSDAAVSGHSDLESRLESSIAEFRTELEAARSDYEDLLRDHAELRRNKDEVIQRFASSIESYKVRQAELLAEVQARNAACEQLRQCIAQDASAQNWGAERQLAVEEIGRLQGALASHVAGRAAAEAQHAAYAARIALCEEGLRAHEAAAAGLLREAAAKEVEVSTLRQAAADNVQSLARLNRELTASDQEIRKNLAAANAARLELATARGRHSDEVRQLRAVMEQEAVMKDAAIETLESRLGQLEAERADLIGRVAGLEATIGEAQRVGETVAGQLATLAGALGMPTESAGSMHALPAMATALSAAVIEARNLLGEMHRSIEALTTEAQRIEEERAGLEQSLIAEVSERERLRRSAIFRLAERWVGARAPRNSGRSLVKRSGLMILTVIHDFLPRHAAGSEIYTFNLLQGLKARGHSVHVLTTESHQGVRSYNLRETAYQGIPVTEVSHQHTTRYFELTWRDRRMNRLFREVLERLRPDVVHIQHLHHHSIDYPAICAEMGIPVVYTLHEYMLLCPRGGQMLRADNERCMGPEPKKCADCVAHLSLESVEEDTTAPRMASRVAKHLPAGIKQAMKAYFGPREKSEPVQVADEAHAAAVRQRLEAVGAMAQHVDLFVSPSQFLRERFIAAGIVSPEQIIYSDNGQDTAPFGRSSRKGVRELRVGYIGTIADYKGLHVLTAAMDLLAERDDITCDIHGSLTSFPQYAEGLREHSRNRRTRFHGRYASDTLPDILAHIDVLVVPSVWWENSPLTIHEAFLAGLPVIASDIGGMAEFVLDGRNGLLFRVGDAADLASQIARCADDRALLDLLRNKDVPIKTLEEDALQTEQRYREIIANRQGRSRT